MPENDLWRSVYQQVPLDIYTRWMVQMRRIARVNGIAVEAFDADDKFKKAHGPRVMTYESLLLLLERTESDDVLRV
jgi:hypothetical protein